MSMGLRRSGWEQWFVWVFASGIGTAVGLGLAFVAIDGVGPVASAAGVGALTGGAQWLVLRKPIRRAGWWVPASLSGWAVGWAGGLLLCTLLARAVNGASRGQSILDSMTESGILVAVLGMIGTGVGLLQWLVLRRQVPQAGWWVPASALGWVVALPAWGMILLVSDVGGPFVAVAFGVALAGAGALAGAANGAITGIALVWFLRSRPGGLRSTPGPPSPNTLGSLEVDS